MSIYEFKSPDKPTKINIMVEGFIIKNKLEPLLANQCAIYVNDRLCTDSHKMIRPRSKVVFFDKKSEKPQLEVIFETKELIILNKPDGLPTQKTLKTEEDNLYDQVRLYFFLDKNLPQGVPYVGLHHRLDRMTSGLVLMTKQRSANKEVADLFKNKKIIKEYSAYCQWGKAIPPKKWVEKNKIGRATHKNHRFYFGISEKGDEAITEYELMDSLEGSWHHLICRPLTGRTHQLRVQLSHLGWSIIGDRVYGKKQKEQRLMLHAQKLSFKFKDQNVCVEVKPRWSLPSQT